MNATVIGLGLIGGSLCLDLKIRKYVSKITGVDANESNRKDALNLGLVDQVGTLEEAIPESDLVILAVPVNAILTILPKVMDLLSPQTTLTDMGSTKLGISQLIKNHPNRKQFVLAHPMAGTENSGPKAAQYNLFVYRTAVICDSEENHPAHLNRITNMFKALKMRMIHMKSEEHDIHVAYVSHLSHISSFVLANTVLAKEKNEKRIFDLAGGGFESTVRLAKSSPEMWSPIFEQNLDPIREAVEVYIEQLTDFHTALTNKDFAKLQNLMNDANQIRRVLDNLSK